MKNLTTNALKALLTVAAFSFMLFFAQTAKAQTKELTHDFAEFAALNVTEDFEVTLAKGNPGIKLTVDTQLAPYVNTYVKGNTLFLSYDEKAVPKDVKKLYKGKNAPVPIMRAVVYTPVLETITLANNTSLTGTEEFNCKHFELNLGDKANVKQLNVFCSTAKISMKKNSEAVLNINSESSVDVELNNNANLKLTATVNELNVTTLGSASAFINGDAISLKVDAQGKTETTAVFENPTESVVAVLVENAAVTLTGNAGTLVLNASKNSVADFSGLAVVDSAEVTMNSGKATISPAAALKVNLISGATLYFNGTPSIQVDKIIKSTLAPSGTPLK